MKCTYEGKQAFTAYVAEERAEQEKVNARERQERRERKARESRWAPYESNGSNPIDPDLDSAELDPELFHDPEFVTDLIGSLPGVDINDPEIQEAIHARMPASSGSRICPSCGETRCQVKHRFCPTCGEARC